MTELKPCPFCGGKARYFMDTLVYGPPQHIAYCTKCGGRTHGLDSKEEAIESWNKRPNPWHTGIPTEGGLYFVYDKYAGYGKRELPEDIEAKDLELVFTHDVAWQKITPYEEKEK